MADSRPPVIIIGMHRSGTSLLTRALQDAGFFMGRGASRNEEAAFTNAINAWLFREASATWDRPEPMDDLLADRELMAWLTDYVGGVVDGPAAIRFLGMRRWLGRPGFHRQTQPWGWKDPRNTWTLPLWLSLFPEARVLHIVRHGVDVAASLRTRRQMAMAERLSRYRQRRRWYRANPLAPKRSGFGPQVRCATLAGGFALWEAYVARSREHLAAVGERGLEIAYEDLLCSPTTELDRALHFCGCHPGQTEIERAAAGVDARRAHAWQRDPELAAFATEVSDRLAAHGYHAANSRSAP